MNIKTIEFKTLNEKMYMYTHQSGLKAYVIPKTGYNKKFAVFGTNFGSIHNEYIIAGEEKSVRLPDGIAHFLEHKLFETEDGSVMEAFAKRGAQPNAYTNFGQTAYLFSCTDQFEDNFKMLLSFVQNPYLTEESIEKEKGIIGQEIRMYDDNAEWRTFFNLLKAMYKNHTVKIDIAGTIESIQKIDKQILLKCHELFYHPSNMAIFVAGDIEPQGVFDAIDNVINNKKEIPKVQVIIPEEDDAIAESIIEQSMDVAMPIFQMGIKDNIKNLKGNDFVIRETGLRILLQMLLGKSSSLYNELYNSGLINFSFDFDCVLETTYGHTVIGGESKDPKKVKDIFVEHIQKLRSTGLNKEDFERTKRALKGKFLRKLNSVEKICQTCMSLHFKDANVFDYYDVYDNISFEFIENLFSEHFVEERIAISIVKPLKGAY